MTVQEFEDRYCHRSGISHEYYCKTFVTLACDCGEDICNGWAAVSNNPASIKIHEELYGKWETADCIKEATDGL